MMILGLIAFFLVLLIITGFTAIILDDLLGSVIVFSAFSFIAVILYLILGSPDVAFTEAVIGVISSIFFIVALKRLSRWCVR